MLGKESVLRKDHKSLRWLHNFQGLDGQLARWLEQLASFQYKIVHHPGRVHANADALSRLPAFLPAALPTLQKVRKRRARWLRLYALYSMLVLWCPQVKRWKCLGPPNECRGSQRLFPSPTKKHRQWTKLWKSTGYADCPPAAPFTPIRDIILSQITPSLMGWWRGLTGNCCRCCPYLWRRTRPIGMHCVMLAYRSGVHSSTGFMWCLGWR